MDWQPRPTRCWNERKTPYLHTSKQTSIIHFVFLILFIFGHFNALINKISVIYVPAIKFTQSNLISLNHSRLFFMVSKFHLITRSYAKNYLKYIQKETLASIPLTNVQGLFFMNVPRLCEISTYSKHLSVKLWNKCFGMWFELPFGAVYYAKGQH